MRAFNVYLNGKKTDTVFYSGKGTDKNGLDCEEVRRSLINHDGYDSGITVREDHKTTTHTEYVIQGHYSQGWEDVTAEETRKEALQRLKEYQENEPGTPHRLISRRVKIAA